MKFGDILCLAVQHDSCTVDAHGGVEIGLAQQQQHRRRNCFLHTGLLSASATAMRIRL